MSGCLSNLCAKLSSRNGVRTIGGASSRSTMANAPNTFFCGNTAMKSAKQTSAAASRSSNLLANRLHAASLPVLSLLIKITVPYVPSPKVCSTHRPLHLALYSATYRANVNLKHIPFVLQHILARPNVVATADGMRQEVEQHSRCERSYPFSQSCFPPNTHHYAVSSATQPSPNTSAACCSPLVYDGSSSAKYHALISAEDSVMGMVLECLWDHGVPVLSVPLPDGSEMVPDCYGDAVLGCYWA